MTLNDVVDQLRADYDATPYTADSVPQSAPGQLAAIAHLFGLKTPEVSTARVLEIGCATGVNLIPFAAAQPQARVVGIDLSPVQIETGRARVQALGLRNLELVTGDIARLDVAAIGQFDFVIAHGVYSWVPSEVQAALLSAIAAVLSPDGVAYVSYNVYPGWKSKEILRDAMMLASGGGVTPDEKIRSARSMLDFLGEVAPPDGVLARVVTESKAFAEHFGGSYVLHDELESINSPCYFYEMVERAGAHGLAYLAEARPEVMLPGNYGPRVAEYVLENSKGVQVLAEQYLDFVANRVFRESLLVHADRAPRVQYNPDGSRYARLHVAASLPPADGQTRVDHSRQEYVESDGATLFTNDPGIKVALDALSARWPWTLSRQELIEAARARLIAAGLAPSDSLPQHIDNLMGVLILQGQARFRLDPVAPEFTETPVRVDEVARRMAETTREDGPASTFNRWHETLTLSPVDSHLLPLLDGTRDRDALVAALVAVDRENAIPIGEHGTQVLGDAERRAALAESIDALPQRLSEMKLL